jgi:hypothetical protein
VITLNSYQFPLFFDLYTPVVVPIYVSFYNEEEEISILILSTDTFQPKHHHHQYMEHLSETYIGHVVQRYDHLRETTKGTDLINASSWKCCRNTVVKVILPLEVALWRTLPFTLLVHLTLQLVGAVAYPTEEEHQQGFVVRACGYLVIVNLGLATLLLLCDVLAFFVLTLPLEIAWAAGLVFYHEESDPVAGSDNDHKTYHFFEISALHPRQQPASRFVNVQLLLQTHPLAGQSPQVSPHYGSFPEAGAAAAARHNNTTTTIMVYNDDYAKKHISGFASSLLRTVVVWVYCMTLVLVVFKLLQLAHMSVVFALYVVAVVFLWSVLLNASLSLLWCIVDFLLCRVPSHLVQGLVQGLQTRVLTAAAAAYSAVAVE